MDLVKLNFMTYQNNLCLICNIPLEMRYPKPGQTWKAFMGCPNYKNHPPKITDKPLPGAFKAPQTQQNAVDPNLVLLDEIQALRTHFDTRMTDMANYLKSKLG